MMSDVAVVPVPVVPSRDWSELPLDVLCFLFSDKLGAVDVFMGAGLVCRSWLQAAKAPDVWRSVEMEGRNDMTDRHALRAMAKAAVDRSAGRLEVFAGTRFVTSELLLHIAERSPALKTLRLTGFYCLDRVFIQVMKKSSLVELECLEIEESGITGKELTAILDGCPRLEILKLQRCEVIGLDDVELRAKCGRIRTLSTIECHYNNNYLDYFTRVYVLSYFNPDGSS